MGNLNFSRLNNPLLDLRKLVDTVSTNASAIKKIALALTVFLIVSVRSVAQELFPYLQAPEPNAIWVTWKTAGPNQQTRIDYGTSENLLTFNKNGSVKILSDTEYDNNYYYHSVQLTGLEPNTRYYYKITTGSRTSQTYSFRTAPAKGQTLADGHLRFIVAGDNQVKGETRYDTLLTSARRKAIEKFGPNYTDYINMVVNVGDQVNKGTLDEYENVHLAKTRYLSPVLPFNTIVGNHEFFFKGVYGIDFYRDHFFYDHYTYQGISSGTDDYYAFQVGRVLFLMLSTEDLNNIGAAQLAWAKNVINAAKVDNTVDFIVTEGHRPIAAEQYVDIPTDLSTWIVNNIIPELVKTPKAVLFIGGHHHLYARGQHRDKPFYHMISGGAAWEQYWNPSVVAEQDRDDIQKTIPNWNYQIVDFNTITKEMTVETYSTGSVYNPKNNELIDVFHRKLDQPAPAKPSLINVPTTNITLPLTLQSSNYSSPISEPYNSTQFQVSKLNDFSVLELDKLRDFENLFGKKGNQVDESQDLNAGVDIFKYTITANSLPNGTYYARLRHRDKNVEWSEWSNTVTFTVENSNYNNAPAISVAKSVFATSENVIVNFTNAPNNSTDWIGLYKKGEIPGTPGIPATRWNYVQDPSGSVTLSKPVNAVPLALGEYYLAFFSDNYNEIANRIVIHVKSTISIPKKVYATTDNITVTFTSAPDNATDWIGLYKKGETPGIPNNGGASAARWNYTEGASGSVTLSRPANPVALALGEYYLAFFSGDYNEIADRVQLYVGPKPTLISNKEKYYVGDTARISYSGGSGDTNDWIGIYRVGKNPGPANQGGDVSTKWAYVDGANGTLDFAGLPEGSYFASYFINKGYFEPTERIYFQVKQSENYKVFLLMGQSNMSGRGNLTSEYLQKQHPRVKVLGSDMNWKLAKHPLHFDAPNAAVGPGLAFGQVLAEAYPQDTIALVPCAVGGTPIAKWEAGAYHNPTNTYPYDDAINRIRIAKQSGEIAGVIWLQGEADANVAGAQVYRGKLLKLIEDIRAEVNNPKLPFVLGEIGYFPAVHELINKELRKAPYFSTKVSLATAENLNHKGDNLHFDSPSMETYGTRFGNKMLDVINNNATATSFITIWDTNKPSGTYSSAGNTTIKLPVAGGTYVGSWVKVGEPATNGTFTSATLTDNIITLPSAGSYEVTISSVGTGFYWQIGANFQNTDCQKLMEVKQWGNLWIWGDKVSMFRNCVNMQVTATDAPRLAGTLNNMFLYCTALTGNASFNTWDVTAVSSMNTMFYGCENFNANISAWNMTNVEVTANMFYDAKAFNQPLNTWNVSSVTNMNSMFRGTLAFNQPLNDWNTTALTTMADIFRDAKAFNQPLDKWKVSSVTSMLNAFYNSGFNNPSIGRWTLKAGVNLSNFLFTDDGTGMSCVNFSKTLKGLAYNTSTPNGLTLGATGRLYGDTASYKKLTSLVANGGKNWTISGVNYDGTCALSFPKTPNVVFIMVDDLGYGELGSYGNNFNETPNLDLLATNSKRFKQAYAAGPICSPTRASLMTGQYPARVGITDFLGATPGRYLDPANYITLNRALSREGYHTGIVGKWHLDTYYGNPKASPQQHGFNEVIGSETKYIGDGDYFYPYDKIETITSGASNEYLTDRQNTEANNFIRRNKDKPFFLYLSYYSVHSVLAAPQQTVNKYKAKFDAKYGVGAADLNFKPESNYQTNHKDNPYLAAMIEHIDNGVGSIMQTLRDEGLDENTIVVFTSDNGGGANMANNGGLRSYKSWLYEGGIRVPLIINWPGNINAGEVQEAVSSIDFYPTLVAAAGGDVNEYPVDGKSLMPLLTNGTSLNRDELYWHYPSETSELKDRMATAVRKGDYKLIKFYQGERYELYNIAIDSSEQNNLIAVEQAKVTELSALIDQWKAEVNAEEPNLPAPSTDKTEHAIINHADPTIFYHDGTYHLYGTSSNSQNGVGFTVYTSTDLKKWSGTSGPKNGFALDSGDVFGTEGFWAPQVFKHNNTFYMAYTASENIALASSNSPLGPFTQQVKQPLFQSGRNIDPFVFIDDDGKKYMYYVVVGGGQNRIFVAEMENDLSAVRTQTAVECIRATAPWEMIQGLIIEGPTVVKRNGVYFLMYSANHFENANYAVGYATSISPTGPWTKFAGNPILRKEQSGMNGTGHGDLFQDANGNWKYVFHTHASMSNIHPRKTAMIDAEFTSATNLTVDPSSFYYLKRTIYFKQDFNMSTTLASYKGKGGNQFDEVHDDGNSGINALNNKLRIVKNGGTGVNRAGAVKTLNPFNPGGIGGFIKFAMDVNVSNNATNVAKGFRVSVGVFGSTTSAAPINPNIHSDLYINPRSTSGSFVLQGGLGNATLTSEPLSGTQKLVWYINNTGQEVGYLAPDGTTGNLMNDAADVWAISGTTATLMLDNVPATSPTVQGLRTFKISSDANFVATLDIDNMMITEEPILPVTLPVSLTSFTGRLSGNQVNLRWDIAEEKNNSHFEILRSVDGKTFQTMDTIAGNGTSNHPHVYGYTDSSPSAGVNYYQLKQVDFDGRTTSYPEIISVKSSIKTNEFRAYFVDNQLNLSIYSEKNAVGDVLISDILGRRLYHNNIPVNKGYNLIPIPSVSQYNGLFVGRLIIDGKRYSVKFSGKN